MPSILFCHSNLFACPLSVHLWTFSEVFLFSIFNIICPVYQQILLCTCPSHLNLTSLSLPPNCLTCTVPLIGSFLSFLFTPNENQSIFISATCLLYVPPSPDHTSCNSFWPSLCFYVCILFHQHSQNKHRICSALSRYEIILQLTFHHLSSPWFHGIAHQFDPSVVELTGTSLLFLEIRASTLPDSSGILLVAKIPLKKNPNKSTTISSRHFHTSTSMSSLS